MSDTFTFKGFAIPKDLAHLTGGGPETWDGISLAHMHAYERYCPIRQGHRVLEIGCGVGRDAIPLTEVLGDGSYLGLDIIKPSIDWCRENITSRFSNFRFEHLDLRSPFYNPGGTLSAADVKLPVREEMDRILLQSVFTHMFESDILHYLKEFRSHTGAGSRVFASWFVMDDESLTLANETDQPLKFTIQVSEGCRIADVTNPEGAVGYTRTAIERLLTRTGFELDQPIHRGSWCGRTGVPDGQDITILRPIPLGRRLFAVATARRRR